MKQLIFRILNAILDGLKWLARSIGKLLISILGALGILPVRNLKYKKTDKDKFIKELTKCTILLTRKRNKTIAETGFWKWLCNFFGRAIQVVTNSYWSHTIIYMGKIHDEHKIIEALAKVEITDLDKYLIDDYQLKAWSRPLTDEEQKLILRECRRWEGKPYDVFEIVHHIFSTPHSDKLVVCSSLGKKVYEPVEKISKKSPSPGDLDKYFKKHKYWSYKTFNY